MNNDINDIIKQQVDRYKSEVDPQEIWEGILKKQKPKRRFLFFVVPIGFLFVIGFSFLIWSQVNTYTQFSEVDLDEKTPIVSAQVLDENKISIKEARPKSHKDLITNDKAINEIKSVSEVSSIIVPLEDDSSLSQAQRNTLDNNEIPSRQNFSNANSKNLYELGTTRNSLIKTLAKSNQKEISSFLESTSKFSTAIISGKSALSSIALLPSIDNLLKSNTSTVSFPQSNIIMVEREYFPKASFIIKAIAQAGWAKNVLSTNNLETYSANLMIERSLFRNFSFSTGVSIERLYEKFEWSGNYVIDSEGNNVGLAETDDQGNAVVNFSSAQYDEAYYEIVERSINKYNRSKFVDIPLALAYNTNISGLRTSLSIGTSINIAKKVSGTKLDENRIPSELSIDNFKVGSKYYLGLEVLYPLSNSMSIYGTLNYSKRGLSIQSINNSVHYYQAGLGLGFRL